MAEPLLVWVLQIWINEIEEAHGVVGVRRTREAAKALAAEHLRDEYGPRRFDWVDADLTSYAQVTTDDTELGDITTSAAIRCWEVPSDG